MEEKPKMSTLKSLEKLPWFAIAGVLIILNMILSQQSPQFMSIVVPAYLAEALFFIGLGYGFIKGHTGQGFAVFLMGLVWMLQTALVSSGADVSVWLWLLLLAQIALAYYFFTGKTLRFAGEAGQSWTYAAIWIVFVTGLGKFILGLTAGSLAQISLWGLGVLLISAGYIVKPIEDDWALPLHGIGTLLCVVSAFTMTGPGLQLLV